MAASKATLKQFRGVNLRTHPMFLEENELADCKNFNVGLNGELVKRFGFETLDTSTEFGAADVRMLGLFNTSASDYILATNGTKVFYTTDGITWTELQLAAASIDNATWGVQYVDKFYITRSDDTIIEWDGTTTAALTGSPSGEMAVIHKERMFVLNTFDTNGSRITFSDIGDPATWPGSNFIDVQPGDGEYLTSMAVYQDVLFIFKVTTLWGLYVAGEPADWTLRSINPSVGCTSKYAIREIEGLLYFIGVRGIYTTDGNRVLSISDDLEPNFRNRLIGDAQINQDCLAWWNDRIITLLNRYETPETWAAWSENTWGDLGGSEWGGDSVVRSYWVYNVKAETPGWTEWTFPEGIEPHTFLEAQVENPPRGLYAGTWNGNGFIYRQETTTFVDTLNDDTEVEYTATFKTKMFDFDSSSEKKRLKWTSAHVIGVGTIDLQYLVDGDAQAALSQDTSLNDSLLKYAGPGYFHTVQLIFSATTGDRVRFNSAVMHLHLKRSIIKTGAHG